MNDTVTPPTERKFDGLNSANRSLTVEGAPLRSDFKVTQDHIDTYARDGVVFLKGALSATWLNLANMALIRSLKNPGPYGQKYFDGLPGEFHGDYCNYRSIGEYQQLLKTSPIADIVKEIIQTENLWLYYDQLFVKEGGYCRRTPWPQDLPYWLADGKQIGSMWFSLDPLSKADSLECIPGSHLNPMFNPSNFNPDDETDPKWKNTPATRLPDIEKDRIKFNIASWDFEPGDVLVLHPGVLHGGAATENGQRRRTLSIRFYGDDVVYSPPPEGNASPPFWGVAETHKPGDKLRHDWFPLIRSSKPG